MVENPNVSTTSARQLQSRGAVAMPQREFSEGEAGGRGAEETKAGEEVSDY